jgi:hypothetical protein
VSKAPDAFEKKWMDMVASLGCLICGRPTQLHHPRFGHGMGERAEHTLVIPLCPDCHTGAFSIHKTPKQFQAVHGDELSMLAETIRRVVVAHW